MGSLVRFPVWEASCLARQHVPTLAPNRFKDFG